jgi:gliding motility-associated-like protein
MDPISFNCFSAFIDLESSASTSTGPNIVYIWFDQDGNLIGNTPTIQIQAGGVFTFVVLDTISGCFADDTVTVNDLIAYPPVDAGDTAVINCNQSTVWLNEGAQNSLPNLIFQWTGPPGGILSPDTALSVLAGIPGHFYYLTATDTLNMCTNTDSVWVSDLTTPPIADIDIVQPIGCEDTIAILSVGTSSSGTGILYNWSGAGVNGSHSSLIEPSQYGVYLLEVINSLTGCRNADSVMLHMPAPITDVLATIMHPICSGDPSGSITIEEITGGTPPYLYLLDGAIEQTSPVFDSLDPGMYTIIIVDANGCSYEESFTIEEGSVMTIDIGPDIELELGDSITLAAEINMSWDEVDSIVWAPSELLSCTHCFTPTLYGLQSGIVSATIYASGCLAEDMLNVRVDIDANIYIPNVFSPNDDGVNDYVTVFTDHRVRKILYLEIFDRWGNQVFVANNIIPNDPLLGWDGSFRGKKMNPAVFAYIARVELINGDTIDRKGDITIIR